MVRYMCTNCNHTHELESSSECPFCGMDNLQEEKSARELLEDVERLLNE